MIDLTINTQNARGILTDFIRSEITRVGFQRAVIGLSGGIDSALSCFLAAEALGPEKILAVRMPYRTSSPDSLEHAQLVIDELGVQAETVPITAMAKASLSFLELMETGPEPSALGSETAVQGAAERGPRPEDDERLLVTVEGLEGAAVVEQLPPVRGGAGDRPAGGGCGSRGAVCGAWRRHSVRRSAEE